MNTRHMLLPCVIKGSVVVPDLKCISPIAGLYLTASASCNQRYFSSFSLLASFSLGVAGAGWCGLVRAGAGWCKMMRAVVGCCGLVRISNHRHLYLVQLSMRSNFFFSYTVKTACSCRVNRIYVGSLQNQLFFLRILEKMVQSL